MTPTRILAVLLISTITVSCREPQASSDLPSIIDKTYRLADVSLASSGGYFFVKLADDTEANGSNSGQNFRIHIRNISVDVSRSPNPEGTYIQVRGHRKEDYDVDLSSVYDATILVRKSEQVEQWSDFIQEQKEMLYGPKDVSPPTKNSR